MTTPPNGAPRIQMTTGQISACEELPEWVGKFVWELHLGAIGTAEKQILPSCEFGKVYDTEAEAIREGKKAVKLACDAVTQRVIGKDSEVYFDMISKQFRPWLEH